MRCIFLKSIFAAVAGVALFGTSSAMAADGFGAAATGGAGGTAVTVTTLADLTKYCAASGAYIITVSGTITTTDNVPVTSNKTVKGANTSATIHGDLFIGSRNTSGPFTNNVIVENLNFTNPSKVGDGDGISVKNSTTNVFITKCSFKDCADGECDITEQSDKITVSYCKFSYAAQSSHDFCDLIGASDSQTADAGKLHVTMHNNWWSTNCYERMPSDRYGTVHVYNNYYSCTGNLYCIRSRISAQVLVENNYFDSVTVPFTIYVTSGVKGLLHASGNTLVNCTLTNGTDNEAPGTDTVFKPPYSYTLQTAAAAKTTDMASSGDN